MFDVFGDAFFVALRVAIQRRLGRHHAICAVLDRALRHGRADVASTHAIQKTLAELEPGIVANLMADVHKALREDPGHILSAWRDSGSKH